MAKTLFVKIKNDWTKGSYEYKNKIDISNPVVLALFFQDLENIFRSPVRKAFSILECNRKAFPLSI